MHDIPEAEARAILAIPRICEDAPGWVAKKTPKGLFSMICGLLDGEGVGTGLYVELLFRKSPTTGLALYKFTVFQSGLPSPQRIYQLHVIQGSKPPKDWHAMGHEHIGDLREVGPVSWLKWTYADAIAYFCRATNIEFMPPIADPDQFELTMQ